MENTSKTLEYTIKLQTSYSEINYLKTMSDHDSENSINFLKDFRD